MAEFNMVGIEDIEAALLRREKATQAVVPAMLQAGGEVVKKAQQSEIQLLFKGKRSTGDMARSIIVSKILEKDGGKAIEIYPNGKDRHGVRNATKGFVLQYGRKNMSAKPWFTAANTKSHQEALKAIRRTWEDKQNER